MEVVKGKLQVPQNYATIRQFPGHTGDHTGPVDPNEAIDVEQFAHAGGGQTGIDGVLGPKADLRPELGTDRFTLWPRAWTCWWWAVPIGCRSRIELVTL